jgi:S1-C subfamily serine protease
MVLTPSGEVLTNNHVIRGATSIKITLPGTGRSYSARVVGYDVVHDVAVLQAVGASRLKTVSTASARAAVGQSVTAVGNAGGTGRLTSATGSVTGVGKSISVSDGRGGSSRLTGLIETNANVVPGDSGGPLLNSAGNVIGMDTAGSVEYGIGASSTSQAYAIPIARVLSIARQVESGQSSARVHVGGTPFLGIEVASATASPWAPDVGGAVVTGVVPGGPADAAGLTPGDVITGIGGRSVSSPDSLTSALLARKPGQKVAISYTDQLGASQTATVTLTSGPAQ